MIFLIASAGQSLPRSPTDTSRLWPIPPTARRMNSASVAAAAGARIDGIWQQHCHLVTANVPWSSIPSIDFWLVAVNEFWSMGYTLNRLVQSARKVVRQ
jgi:hypothetical protein